MANIIAFGAYVPPRVVTNSELAQGLGCSEDWILSVSGIRERRYAEETVTELAVLAARDCLTRASADNVGLLLVSSGSAERRFPGPAAGVASRLGWSGIPAIDLPIASAGSLFGLSLAAQLAATFGRVLVVAAEKMSPCAGTDPGTAILFGDGAGACLIGAEQSGWQIVDSEIYTDGAFSEDLRLEFGLPIAMNGRSVIMHASRKIPAAIQDLLARNRLAAAEVDVFVMHQANQNLIDKVANTIGVPSERFYSNIARYGNTSSASMLIAAAEIWDRTDLGHCVCFAAFGAGFHWGALLARRPEQ